MQENHKNSDSGSVEQNLAKSYVPKGKLGDLPISNNISDELKKEMEKTKNEIEELKKEITKKFKYIEAIGIVPAQASQRIEEEYEVAVPEGMKNKLMHIVILMPEEKFKELEKVKLEAISIAKKINEKLWVHVMTPVDMWNLCLDSKFEIIEAFAMSYPVLDKGILGALRVAQIHKTLVLKKFEKYVSTYGVFGSMITGTAHADSDVDVAIIIDDTDVKRMPRLELREKLRGIIYSYIQEATAIAGVKNILNVQVWLLTEFWEGVKDANPVFFTFIRDGVPFYDRGTFLPWKTLLKMGKIKPSPESIDMFMSSGDRLEEMITRRLMDIAIIDIYWGVLTPTQGLLMLYGISTPTPKETAKTVREVLCEKEKLLEKKYVDIIDRIISFYKGYEHGKNKKISGAELDKMAKDALDYMKRLKELRKQIEKSVQKKGIEKIYADVFGMLEALLKKNTEPSIIKEFDEQMIKQGKFPQRFLENIKFIAKVKKEFDSGKAEAKKKKNSATGKESREVDEARKMSAEIINALIEHNQRCEFMGMDRARFIIQGKEKKAEVFFLENSFLVEGAKISKMKGNGLVSSDEEELRKQLLNHKEKEVKIDFKALEILKKDFGDFELLS